MEEFFHARNRKSSQQVWELPRLVGETFKILLQEGKPCRETVYSSLLKSLRKGAEKQEKFD